VRVLVTGAGGFIGQVLARRLLRSGHDVTALVRPDSAEGLAASVPDLEIARVDLRQELDATRLPSRVDAVVHLAQSARYAEFPEGSRDVFGVNCEATLRLLEWARGAGAGHFLLASSGSIYRRSAHPIREAGAIEPRDFYSLCKRMGEELTLSYGQIFAVTCARLFCVYGPGQRGRLVPGLVARIRRGDPVRLAGPAGFRINPIHVEDASLALMALLERPYPGCINVGGTRALSIREMAEAIGTMLGTVVRYERESGAPQGDLIGDVSLLLDLVGFVPKIAFEEGLREVVDAEPA